MSEENITLDPEYKDLIIEVNKLKDTVAEKIAERDMLAFHVIPEIENKYMMRVGILENDAFNASLRLLRITRKIEIYKEKLRLNLEISEDEIEKQLDNEFENIEEEYNDLQEELMFDVENAHTDEIAAEFLKVLNIIYKNLIKKLSPLINFDNGRLENQLYELLEKAYRELDASMMSKLQSICEQVRPDSSLIIGDMKSLERAKKKYKELIEENEDIILNIKCSEIFERKRILENESLLRRTKEEINADISQIEEKINECEKELRKLQDNS